MKIVKKLTLGLGLLVLLVIITLGIFVATFDANAYKQDLAALVEQRTGRALNFDGDIGLTLYPSLGMKLGSMRFANAPGFSDQPMLTVNSASVSVDVLSILSLMPRVDQLRLDGLTINLHKNKQGVTNFDDLLSRDASAGAATEKPAETPSTSSADGPLLLGGSFAGLNITNARLSWRDDSSGDEYQVQVKSLVSGAIEADTAFPLTLELSVQNKQALQSRLLLSSQVSVNDKRVQLTGMKLQATASGELVPVGDVQLDLSSGLSYTMADQQMALPGFALKLTSRGGALQRSEISLAGEIGFNVAQQQLEIAVLELQSALTDPSLPRGRLNSNLSASSVQVRLAQKSVDLKDLKLSVEGNDINGQVKVRDYGQPDVEFTLAADELDVDRILGPSDTSGPQQPESTDPSGKQPDIKIALPNDLLRALKMKGQLKVATLRASNMTFSDLNLQVKADTGVLDIQPLTLNLYKGRVDGALQVNVKQDVPVYRVSKKLSSFQIGAFLQDFMGDDRISGTADMDIKLSSRGEWLSQLRAGLNGDMKVQIRDGALKGFNLRHKLEAAKATFKGQAAPAETERKTDFSALSLSGQIIDGVFSSQDLNIQAPLMRVTGQGSADLAKETVDYRVNAKLVGTTKGQEAGGADDFSGVLIPVAITGAWLSPKIDVQLDEMMKARLNAEKARISEQVAREKAALQQKLEEEKDKLRAAQENKLAAEKAQLEKQKQLAIAEEKARLEAQKKAEQEKARDKLNEKLKKLF